MKNTTSSNPKTGVKVVASLLAASQVASAADSTENIESLEPTTVVATKFEKNLSEDGSIPDRPNAIQAHAENIQVRKSSI